MDLKQNNELKEILKVGAPCLLEQSLFLLASTISVSMVGHLGKEALVISSMTNQLLSWLQAAFMGLCSGSTVLIARLWGKKDIQGVKKAFVQSVILVVGLGTLIFLAALMFKRELVVLLYGNADKNLLDGAIMYFSYYMMAMPATALISVINASARGVGDNITAFKSTACVNLTNMVISYVLIYGVSFAGFPAMGLKGAAIAAPIARVITAIFIMVSIKLKNSPIIPNRQAIGFDKKVALRISKIGVPASFESLIFQGGFVMLQTVLLSFGTVFQSGYQIGNQVNGFCNAPCNAISVVATILISQALGKNDKTLALKYVKEIRKIISICFVFLGVFIVVFAPLLAKIYTSDAEAISSGITFIRMFGILIIPLAFLQAMSGVLRGAGDVKYVVVTSVLSLWIFRILAIVLLSKFLDPYVSVIIGVSADYIYKAVAYVVRVKKENWLHINI